MAHIEYHKAHFESLKNVHIFVKDGNLFLEKTKVTYTVHSNGAITHEDPVVTQEEVSLSGYGCSKWDFTPATESCPEKPNFYSK